MALLDRPLFGSEASGPFARALAFRRTANPPDDPGEPVVSMGTVAKIPFTSCRPSADQVIQRQLYAAAVAAWRALSDEERSFYNTNKPSILSGFNFFLRLYLLPSVAFFGYCIFGSAFFQCAVSPVQPTSAEYDSFFPAGLDEFPTLSDGAHSPQAWLFARIYDTLLNIQDYLILHKAGIED